LIKSVPFYVFVPFYLLNAGIEFNKSLQMHCMCAFKTLVLGF